MSGSISFPPNPTVGQIYTFAGHSWMWNGTAWVNANTGANFMPLSGGTFSGPVTLAAEGNAPLQPASVSQASRNVGRNLLDNALFNIWQRGIGPFTAANAYTADRWELQLSLDTASISQSPVNDANRALIGDEAALYWLQNTFTGNSGATAYNAINQRIEGVRRLGGKTVTASFWAVAGAAGLRLGANIYQSFGTGGSPSAPINGPGQSVALTTTPARYSLTFAVPSTSGMTLGTSGGDYTQLTLYYSGGSSFAGSSGNIGVQSGQVWIWGVQLEVVAAVTNPPTVTPLEKRDPETDLARCQRFYCQGQGFATESANAANGWVSAWLKYPTTLRAQPTLMRQDTGPNTNVASFLGYSATTVDNLVITYLSVAAGNASMVFTWEASADL